METLLVPLWKIDSSSLVGFSWIFILYCHSLRIYVLVDGAYTGTKSLGIEMDNTLVLCWNGFVRLTPFNHGCHKHISQTEVLNVLANCKTFYHCVCYCGSIHFIISDVAHFEDWKTTPGKCPATCQQLEASSSSRKRTSYLERLPPANP